MKSCSENWHKIRYLNRIFIRLAILAIRGYQLVLSPIFGPSCRFYPSCSEYTSQAIKQYGLLKGFQLGTRRLLRCHPFHPGGFDPLP